MTEKKLPNSADIVIVGAGVAVGTGTVPSFSITFTAIGTQVSDGNLTLTSEGVKSPTDKW